MQQNLEYPTIDMEAIGERIKRLRKENHLKVTDISEAMGFETPQAVYKWQRGDCLPDTVNLIVLSRMLGTTVEELVLGEDELSLYVKKVYQWFTCCFMEFDDNYIIRRLMSFRYSITMMYVKR